MRRVWIVALLLAGTVWADEAADRRVIAGVIEKLNFTDERASLFVAGADLTVELQRLEQAGCVFGYGPKVWNERPSPRFTQRSVQFVAPNLALADVDYLQFGSVMARYRTPAVAILRREGGEWKIVTVRVMAECPGMPKILPAEK